MAGGVGAMIGVDHDDVEQAQRSQRRVGAVVEGDRRRGGTRGGAGRCGLRLRDRREP